MRAQINHFALAHATPFRTAGDQERRSATRLPHASRANATGQQSKSPPAIGRPAIIVGALLGIALALLPPAGSARETPQATGVIGVDSAQLSADYWIARLPDADRIVLDRTSITAQNSKLEATDDSLHAIEELPATLDQASVRSWISDLSTRPSRTLYDVEGVEVSASAIDGWMSSLALDAIPASQATRYGLVVHRADLRKFPTTTRVFSTQGDIDIDRFQESAFFPGTPVAITHESRDGKWWFVVGKFYAAWIEKQYVAEGSKQAVFDYAHKSPYLVVTGATATTTYTPDQPKVSSLQLDMGVRVPVAQDWPGTKPVNGQAAYTAHVIELPIRNDDGSLQIVPALLPRTNDVAIGYLPLTHANLLRQGFKFLGERYGWGNAYDARDCSSFVSEVYRSTGVELPRNTSDQSVSPALNRIALAETDSREKRMSVVKDLQVGDLVYIPGHVMMVIGHDKGMPYVIHDTNGGSWLGPDGKLVHGQLNGVSVTPLTPMQFNEKQTYVDRITNIQRIRP